MSRHLFLLSGLVALPSWSDTSPVDIPLDHLRLRWTIEEGLSVTCDGRRVLDGSVSPVVAYPPGWAWSYSSWGADKMSASVRTEGDQQVLTVECTDPKLSWRETVTAGPGDRFSIAYTFTQHAWEQAMNYEVCLCRPTTGWFVGSRWRATGPGGTAEGQIPLTFGGVNNPFGNMTRVEFENLFGRLTVTATEPITLYDYAHRQTLWLGRDAACPRDTEQSWGGEFVFEPTPLEVGGVRIASLSAPDRAIGERLTVGFSLVRREGGPERVTARLSCGDARDESEATLGAEPAPVQLTVPLPGPGRYACTLELLAGGEAIYQSPPLSVEVPRLVAITPARLPFMTGDQGAILATIAPEAGDDLRLSLQGPNGPLAQGPVVAGKRTELLIPLTALAAGRNEVSAVLWRGEERLGTARCDVLLAEPRPNAVVVDHRSRTLIVRGLPFVPRSCYTDGSLTALVAEQEAPLGFNCIAPYLGGDIAQRRAERENLRKALDRCAEVGVYVQLDIRSASRAPQDEEKWAWLREEIEAFRDHPALLTYYLADEPELGWSSPEECETAYRKIKELDPWHPVTMVFCQSQAALRYAAGMDIIMTDPYPIPNGPVTSVVDFCERIRTDTQDALPLWIVPQAFGGGEWWRGEPSRQEERVMVYLALIHGCKGVQPFIRRPPLSNPNNPDLWSEVRRLMLEVSQLTPALCSAEEAPKVTCATPQVHIAAFKERGAVTILAANVENKPLPLELTLDAPFNGNAEVLFENRTVPVAAGKLVDMIDAFGTRAYRLQIETRPADRAQMDPKNLIVNGSFEEAHNVGTPDGSYLSVGRDKSSSWFVDPRDAVHGRQSLRLRTPTEGEGIRVAPFPISLSPGKRYRMTIWAKGERPGQRFLFSLDAVGQEQGTHELTTQWQEYVVEFTASEKAGRMSPGLRLMSTGEAWFDAMQVVAVE